MFMMFSLFKTKIPLRQLFKHRVGGEEIWHKVWIRHHFFRHCYSSRHPLTLIQVYFSWKKTSLTTLKTSSSFHLLLFLLLTKVCETFIFKLFPSLFPSQGKQRFRRCIWRLHHQQTFGQRKEVERGSEKPLTDKQISCLSVMDSVEVIHYILVIWHQELPVKVKRIKRFLITSFLHSFNLFRARLIESPAAVCMKPFDSEAFINWVKIAMTWKGFKFQRDLLLQIEFSLERLLNQNKRIARRESLESRITIYIIKRSSTLLIESLMMKMDLVFPDVSWILILVCPYCARIAHLVLRVSS